MGDGLYKLAASDQIPIVQSVNLYVIVFRNKYCLNQGGKKVYMFGVGHMTKMVAIPIYGKNLKIFFFRMAGPISLKLSM